MREGMVIFREGGMVGGKEGRRKGGTCCVRRKICQLTTKTLI